jgi:hypothetical protein
MKQSILMRTASLQDHFRSVIFCSPYLRDLRRWCLQLLYALWRRPLIIGRARHFAKARDTGPAELRDDVLVPHQAGDDATEREEETLEL